MIFTSNGPSPRRWGKLITPRKFRFLLRTIPTQVGKTLWLERIRSWPTDHPHAGGENKVAAASFDYTHGPSPRRWGKPILWEGEPDDVRTIPTQVGKTKSPNRIIGTIKDHPHAGGENRHTLTNPHPVCGPSPRRWGKRIGA